MGRSPLVTQYLPSIMQGMAIESAGEQGNWKAETSAESFDAHCCCWDNADCLKPFHEWSSQLSIALASGSLLEKFGVGRVFVSLNFLVIDMWCWRTQYTVDCKIQHTKGALLYCSYSIYSGLRTQKRSIWFGCSSLSFYVLFKTLK